MEFEIYGGRVGQYEPYTIVSHDAVGGVAETQSTDPGETGGSEGEEEVLK